MHLPRETRRLDDGPNITGEQDGNVGIKRGYGTKYHGKEQLNRLVPSALDGFSVSATEFELQKLAENDSTL